MTNQTDQKMKKVFIAFLTIFLAATMQAQTLQEAYKLVNYENYPKAKMAFKQYIQSNAAYQDGYFHLGALYSRLGNVDSATILFNKVIELNPKSNMATVAMGYNALNKKMSGEAKSLFDKAIKSSKSKDGNVFRWIGEAYLYSPNPNLDLAIEHLKKAVSIEIKNPVSYYSLGEAYFRKGDLGPAVTQFEFTTDYDKSAAWAYTRIGQIFMSARNYTKALDMIQTAIKADPQYALAYRALSDWNYDYQRYPEALSNFEKYLEMTGDKSIDTKIRYSSILFYNKQYDKTISLVNEIMKTEASKDYMIRLLGYSYFEQGDSLAALNMMNNYFAKAPKDKIIFSDYQYLGKIYNKLGQDSLAFLNYEKAIATDSTKTELYSDLATLYYSKGKFLDAAKWYGKKINIMDRPGLQNYFDVAFAYFKAQDYNASLREFGKISEKWPDRLEGYVYQGRSAAYLDPEGTAAMAKPYYEKVIEKGEVDPVKYKDYLREAYNYMFYASKNMNDNAAAKAYADKMLKLNPNDEEAVQLLKSVEK